MVQGAQPLTTHQQESFCCERCALVEIRKELASTAAPFGCGPAAHGGRVALTEERLRSCDTFCQGRGILHGSSLT